MNPIKVIAISAAGAILLFCSPAPHEKGDYAYKGVPAINAHVRLAPLVNASNIVSIEGWPSDTLQQAVIMRRFDKIQARLLSELRRCEKYGLYIMVDDSSEATMTITLTLMPFSRDYDTVTIPAEVKIQSKVPPTANNYKFTPRVLACRDMREKNPFHYVGLIMMNYCNEFPYKSIAHLLYRAEK